MNLVLVHGFLDSARIMSGLARYLSNAGHSCFSPPLKPSDARSGLSALSDQLERFVADSLPLDARFALIGYSMGALVCRHYLQERGSRRRVEAFYSLAGPHAGTVAAFLYPGQGAREMRPKSAFMRRLDEGAESLSNLPIVCYWSPIDPLVVPASSARMRGAEHVRIPLGFHPLLTLDRRIHRDIARRLAGQQPNKATGATTLRAMPPAKHEVIPSKVMAHPDARRNHFLQ
jgi:triacylglycerol lipase